MRLLLVLHNIKSILPWLYGGGHRFISQELDNVDLNGPGDVVERNGQGLEIKGIHEGDAVQVGNMENEAEHPSKGNGPCTDGFCHHQRIHDHIEPDKHLRKI